MRLHWPIAAFVSAAWLFGFVIWTANTAHHDHKTEECAETRHDPQKYHCETLWEKTVADAAGFWTMLLFVVTGGLAVYTAGLWRATIKLGKDSERSIKAAETSAEAAMKSATTAETGLIATARARLSAVAITGLWERNPTTGAIDWRMRPVWQNSGETPTRRVRMFVKHQFRTTVLPADFQFDDPADVPGNGHFGPKMTEAGGIVPGYGRAAITPQQIVAVQNRQQILYMWGWVRYFDIFPDTPERITRFCWLVTFAGNPLNVEPTPNGSVTGMTIGYIHNPEGNCADEECS